MIIDLIISAILLNIVYKYYKNQNLFLKKSLIGYPIQMENAKISITPLHVCYTSRKPLSILLKLKRILISTNYQLQKFQCKKQVPLKNGLADLTSLSTTSQTTFTFNLSQELEFGNTKIDIIVFGFLNKDVNLLGIGTVDLGVYQKFNFADKLEKQIQLKLEKSQDPNAYVLVKLLIERIKKVQKASRQLSSNSDNLNTLKTDSYNRQSLLMRRRKNPDLPTAYEISRKNYKQTQVIRITQQRSNSRSRNNSGSYKKRFQYQYKKEITSLQQQQTPQPPPSQRLQRKSQTRGSPMPRMKTPEPISSFHSDSQILSNEKEDKKKEKERFTEKNIEKSKKTVEQNHKKQYDIDQKIQVKNSQIKIVIDVHQQKKKEKKDQIQSEVEQNIQIQREKRTKQKQKKQQKQNRQKKTGDNQQRTGIIKQIKKQEGTDSQRIKKNKINIPNLNLQKKTQNNLNVVNKMSEGKEEQESFPYNYKDKRSYKQIQSDRDHKNNYSRDKQEACQRENSSNPHENYNYNKYRHTRSYEQEPQDGYSRITKNSYLINYPKNNRYQSESMDSIHEEHEQKQTPRYPQDLSSKYERKEEQGQQSKNKRNSSNQSDNRYKSIVDKFQQIQERIKEANKSSPSQSPNIVKEKQLSTSIINKKEKEQSIKPSQQVGMKSLSPSIGVKKNTDYLKATLQQSANTFKQKSQEKVKKYDQTFISNEGSQFYQPGFQKSVAHFSISQRDWIDKNRTNPKQIQKNLHNAQQQNKNIKPLSIDRENELKSSRKNQSGKVKNLSQNSGKKQIIIKKEECKQKKLIKQFDLKILPDPKNKQDQNEKSHKKCEQKITNLEHLLDHQEEEFRKKLLEKQFEYKNELKKSQKRQNQYQQQLKSLKQENQNFQTNQKASINANSLQLNRLKDQNLKLRNLVDKLNTELEESDEKHFENLTLNEKKDLQYKRKLQELMKKNIQLSQEIKKKQEQLKYNQQKNDKESKISQNIGNNKNSQNSQKEATEKLKQQYLGQKKKNVNLEAQIRIKENEIRFLKIKNENLEEQKKNLQNEIDNIAANNKLQMARQGSITKMNLQASSVTNSVKVENKVLKEEINSLQMQVRELNQLLEGIIIEGSPDNSRIQQNKQKAYRQNQFSLERKYEALQKKTLAYEQEIKKKQMKIAQIINLIFGYNNPKLIDEVSKIMGMSN